MSRKERLFEALAHGDEVHREWLKEAIDCFFEGKDIPHPRQGEKKYTIDECGAALQDALAATADFDSEQELTDFTLDVLTNFTILLLSKDG